MPHFGALSRARCSVAGPVSEVTFTAGSLRAVHARALRITGRARTRFEPGVRRGRAPLAAYAKGDVLLPAC